MQVDQIKSAIINGKFTNADLNDLGEAIRYARAQIGREIKQSIRVGDNVNFSDNKNGTNYTGAVVKINIKYVHVATSKGTYRVPANMLTVV